jgi:hypothetical protein
MREFVWILSRGAKLKMIDWVQDKLWKKSKEGKHWIKLGRKFTGARHGEARAVCLRMRLRKAFRLAKECGWVVRKEDRGMRWVFVDARCEEYCVKETFESRGIFERKDKVFEDLYKTKLKGSHKSLGDIATVYVLPKTHKETMSGRVVEACGRRGRLRWLEDWIAVHCPWDKTSVDAVFRTLGDELKDTDVFMSSSDRRKLIGGDIEKLFPSIPFHELLAFVKVDFPHFAKRLEEWQRESVVLWKGSVWSFRSGMPIGSSWAPQLARYYLGKKERGVIKRFSRSVNFARYVDDVGVLGQVDPQVIRRFKRDYETAVSPLKINWDHSGGVVSLRILNGRVGGRFGEPRWVDRNRRPGPVLLKNDMVEYWASRVREVLSVSGAWRGWSQVWNEKRHQARLFDSRPSGLARALESEKNTGLGIGRKVLGTEQSVTWRHNIARIRALSVEHGCRWSDVMRKVGPGTREKKDKRRVKISGPWWYGEIGPGFGEMRRIVRKAVANILTRKAMASGEEEGEVTPSMIAVVVRPVGLFHVSREALHFRF